MWPHFAFITIHVSLPIFLPQPRNRESFKIKVGKMSSLILIPCLGLLLSLIESSWKESSEIVHKFYSS